LEVLRARFLELAPDGFEEAEHGVQVELAAYGEAATRVLGAFPDAVVSDVEAGWEERWREFHRPVRVGPLWIGPPWEVPDGNAIAVVVDPGRAFGTGAHATTRLCLEFLLGQGPGSVLDIGCGSGVLAIAAAKLGHGPVIAIDFDEAAIEATKTNAAANGVEVDARRLDASEGPLPRADLALANIALGPVEALGGRLEVEHAITSGYLAADEPQLGSLRHTGRRELDGWAADLFERR
jgi:ribosomal protein L11 methyltransferase